jgi:hypothetical protein
MADNQKKDKPSGSTGEIVLQSPGKTTVQHSDLPTKPDKNRKIHLRRPLPPVPEAQDDQSGEKAPRDP